MSDVSVFHWSDDNRYGVMVNRHLRSGKLDLYDLTPEEMIGLANDLLTVALRAMRVRMKNAKTSHVDGEVSR